MPHGCPSQPTPNNPVGTPAASVPSPDGRRARPSGLLHGPRRVVAAIVFINGFLQGVGPAEGLRMLYAMSYWLWWNRRDVLLLHRTENANHKETADLILAHNPVRIFDVSYSYGAGRGLTGLARHLQEHGRDIDAALLVDPVTRYRILKPMSLGWWGRDRVSYRVPENVREVYAWRQVNHRGMFDPLGHRVAAGPDTRAHSEIVMGSAENLDRHAPGTSIYNRRVAEDVNHSSIDSHPIVQREVLTVLKSLVPPPPPEHPPCAA